VVRKPQRITIRQYMSRMGILNDYIARLPSIFYSPESPRALLPDLENIE